MQRIKLRKRRGRLWPINQKPIVIAHRGGGNEEPENSLDAFAHMSSKGFRFMETDAHSTSDGVAVLFHDSVLDRTTDGTGPIGAHTWAQIQQVKDGSGNSPLRLDSALMAFPDLVFNIDAKSWTVVEPLARTLLAAGATDHVSLASFSERRLRVMRKALPGLRSSLGTGAIAGLVALSHLPMPLAKLLVRLVPGPKQNVEAAQVPMRWNRVDVVTNKFVKLCHSRGLSVHVWTINSAKEMKQLLAMRVDGIITDEPTLAQSVIDDYWAGLR